MFLSVQLYQRGGQSVDRPGAAVIRDDPDVLDVVDACACPVTLHALFRCLTQAYIRSNKDVHIAE